MLEKNIENKNLCCAIYCRVSVEDKLNPGLSIDSQELVCRRKAEEEGYSILEVVKDDGISGKNLKRPGIQKILRLVSEKTISAIYVVHKDRLSRNMADHIFLTDLFRKNKIVLRSINEPLMDNSAASITMDMMMASFNQYHRLNTAEKVRSVMNEKAKSGFFPGLAPLGYKNITDQNNIERFGRKIIAIDKETAPFVTEAFKLFSTGNYNVIDVNDIIYEKGLRKKSGGKLSASMLYAILKNRFYIGEVHWGDAHIIEGKHPALIDKDLFERVQRILNSNNKHSCRKRKFQWLLGGFIKCHRHECRYTSEWHLGKKIAYYHCTHRNGCGKYIEINKLEQMVAEKFKMLELSQEFIDLIIDKVRNIFYDRRESYESKRQGLINQRNAFEAKLKTAENKMLSNIISDEDFTRIRNEIKIELNAIDKKIISIQREKEIDVDIAKEIIGLTSNIYETYQKASPQLKRLLLGFFWDRFEVCDGLIIKSIPSVLFEELIKVEKGFIKSENPYMSNVSNGFIKFDKWCPCSVSENERREPVRVPWRFLNIRIEPSR